MVRQFPIVMVLGNDSRIYSVQFSLSPEGIVFQEPWKPWMASRSSRRIHAFLETQYTFGAYTGEVLPILCLFRSDKIGSCVWLFYFQRGH